MALWQFISLSKLNQIGRFGSSKRIRASSNFQSDLFGMVPYVDQKALADEEIIIITKCIH
jgi:hypothetical protein